MNGYLFSDSFTHLKTRNIAENKQLLLSVILADAINLGLSKMAEATPDTTYSKLASGQGWHIQTRNILKMHKLN